MIEAAPPTASVLDASASGAHALGLSHGSRLLMALDGVDRLPVLADARHEVLRLVAHPSTTTGTLAAAVESDPGLASAVVRFANRYGDPLSSPVATVRAAVGRLGHERVCTLARRLPTFSLSGRTDPWIDEISSFRVHALAVARTARRLARELGHRQPDLIATAALFHDVGKLVLARTHRDYTQEPGAQPEERIAAEREMRGVDHAVIGGVVARRWGLPASVATAIEHHHAPEATGHAALVRLADMLVHYTSGASIALDSVRDAAERAGLHNRPLAELLGDSPWSGAAQDGGEDDACPLTPRQLELIRGLARGKQYKEIAHEIGVSASTVRSHLHGAYARLGVADRAQAVLMASQRGWIGPVAITSAHAG